MNRRRAAEFGLILLAVLVTVGTYALAGLGGSGPGDRASIPADAGPFLLEVLLLLVLAHLAVRRWAPDADGTLLPIAALLNGIGYAMIVRLDEDLAKFQATWTLIGIGAFIVTLGVVREVRVLARYRWTLALVGFLALVAPIAPVIGREINAARLWIHIGPVNVQPGEFAKIALAVFVASYLVEKRELLALGTARIGPFLVPDLKHLGPGPPRVGRVAACHGVRTRSRVVAARFRDVRHHVVGGHRSWLVSRCWNVAVRGGRSCRLVAFRPRPVAGSYLVGSVAGRLGRGVPDHPGVVCPRVGGADRYRAWTRLTPAYSGRGDRLHLCCDR